MAAVTLQTLHPARRIVLVLIVTAITGCAARNTPDVDTPPRLRVMTYNIHHGRGADGVIDLPRIAAVINAARPHLVALQEVDIRTRRSGGTDQLAELAKLTNMHAHFGKGRDFEGGDYGQAVLSRWPIASAQVHALPPDNEADRRIALAVRIAGDGKRPDVHFISTHLHHADDNHRFAQAKRLIELLDDDPAVILTGDLNAIPGSATIDLLLEHFTDTTPDTALTFPAAQPTKKIDYVLLPRGSEWRVMRWKVIEESVASDHRPVVVELQRAP